MIMLYLATLLLAFCSIVYELLLGQVLSAFFEIPLPAIASP